VVGPAAGERTPLSKMRRAIVAAMNLSAQIPQFTLDRWIDLTHASAIRQSLKEADINVSWEDIFVAACARALRSHPGLNASFDDDAIIHHAQVNIGIATALADGLVSPAILDADRLSMAAIAAARARLREQAAVGRLRGVELSAATFTISNLGLSQIDRFRALVIPPQAAILAVGRVRELNGAPGVSVSLSCDHRVVDGTPAAEFLKTVNDLLQAPQWCLPSQEPSPLSPGHIGSYANEGAKE
jgi:pyruvate dehydrogenase E2 component (dihydrolipoamide acetyltransferase)